jgi:hypothetical protein
VSALTGTNDVFKPTTITGKSSCLVWLLLTRLARGQRTALQTTPDYFWLFDDSGALKLDALDTLGSDPGSRAIRPRHLGAHRLQRTGAGAMRGLSNKVLHHYPGRQPQRVSHQDLDKVPSLRVVLHEFLLMARSRSFGVSLHALQRVSSFSMTGPRRPVSIAPWSKSLTSSMPVMLAPA